MKYILFIMILGFSLLLSNYSTAQQTEPKKKKEKKEVKKSSPKKIVTREVEVQPVPVPVPEKPGVAPEEQELEEMKEEAPLLEAPSKGEPVPGAEIFIEQEPAAQPSVTPPPTPAEPANNANKKGKEPPQ